jgi:hypothetical protein
MRIDSAMNIEQILCDDENITNELLVLLKDIRIKCEKTPSITDPIITE